METNTYYYAGIDIGSTTVKLVLLNEAGEMVWGEYRRHCAHTQETLAEMMREARKKLGACRVKVRMTGSGAISLAEALRVGFVQEVVAVAEALQKAAPQTDVAIELGGEDAKIIYFTGGLEERMNGVCAGGTGSFIDQMAALLKTDAPGLNELAKRYHELYPIAARCGVFAKSDIQPLINEGAAREDLAASIFQAVVNQTISGLACGKPIRGHVAFLGGPLHFLSELRQAFVRTLHLTEETAIVPENSHLFAATGAAMAALSDGEDEAVPMDSLLERLEHGVMLTFGLKHLPPLFRNQEEYAAFNRRHAQAKVQRGDLETYSGKCYLGIDAGSTTTKVALIGEKGELLYSYYAGNSGSPIETARTAMRELMEKMPDTAVIARSCSTGYGESLLKSAFRLDDGEVETIAHCTAAAFFDPKVDCVLDIGGQDMKAMFVKGGALYRMELNEACSSGCGAFLETFARSLGYTAEQFAQEACRAKAPCDLGTRCTVFMNSKVKQALREGATVEDIAAGLSYSVVRNCLYKVLKIKDTAELGEKIVLQGGTMRNDSIVRAFERLTGHKAYRSNVPELMGAYGCALYARACSRGEGVSLEQLLNQADYSVREIHCHGCENGCAVSQYKFVSGNVFYSGNKCEKVFSNRGCGLPQGRNAYTQKYEWLFGDSSAAVPNVPADAPVVGIPRCLGMYEDYPFWRELFRVCGIRTVLSDPSTFAGYEAGVHSVMSDNICFPAKLAHSHVYNLMDKGVDRIFMPYTIFESRDDRKAVNSYNCPVVAGYSDVIRSAVDLRVPLDSPTVNFKDEALLEKCCADYLKATFGVPESTVKKAVRSALAARREYEERLRENSRRIYEKGLREDRIVILLAGRPYHTDPLVQHKISDMVASMGADVITEDIVRGDPEISLEKIHAEFNLQMQQNSD